MSRRYQHRATCPYCGLTVAAKGDGTIKAHATLAREHAPNSECAYALTDAEKEAAGRFRAQAKRPSDREPTLPKHLRDS